MGERSVSLRQQQEQQAQRLQERKRIPSQPKVVLLSFSYEWTRNGPKIISGVVAGWQKIQNRTGLGFFLVWEFWISFFFPCDSITCETPCSLELFYIFSCNATICTLATHLQVSFHRLVHSKKEPFANVELYLPTSYNFILFWRIPRSNFLFVVQFWSHTWQEISLASWRKYPCDSRPDVLAWDLVDYHVDEETGVLTTKRVLYNKSQCPKWLSKVSKEFLFCIMKLPSIHPFHSSFRDETLFLLLHPFIFISE